MNIKKKASEVKIKNQRWLQEFPSKLREWKRFSGINCSVSVSSVVFLSVAIFGIYSAMKKRKNKRSGFYSYLCMLLWWFFLLKDWKEQRKVGLMTCDILVQWWWQDWHLQREFRQIRLYQGSNIWVWALC